MPVFQIFRPPKHRHTELTSSPCWQVHDALQEACNDKKVVQDLDAESFSALVQILQIGEHVTDSFVECRF
jgi:hypothetical protein